MSGTENFWSRRRAGVAAEEAARKAALEQEVIAAEQAALEGQSDEEILAKLDLTDPDTLVDGDDFKAFMAKAVPEHLRRRALRTLWRSNPVLANVDMLVDYGEDFTDAATVIENMQTTYQVGKGMLKHVEEMVRQAEEAEKAKEAEDALEAVEEDDDALLAREDDAAADADDDAIESSEPSEILEFAIAEDLSDSEGITLPLPRRMKFRPEESSA